MQTAEHCCKLHVQKLYNSRLLLAKYYDEDKIGAKMGRASSMYGTEQSCIQNFGVKM